MHLGDNETTGPDMTPSPTILVVEDNEATRSSLVELLTKAGHTVQSAATFAEASRALKAAPPSLLITDVRLGEYNGLQLLATSLRPIPAIVVTGFDDPVIRAEAHRLGADFVVKPLSGKDFLTLVARKLAAVSGAPPGGPVRHSVRKPVSGPLPACIEGAPVRIVDVSYEGVRLELDHAPQRALPCSFGVSLPEADFTINVDLVWSNRRDDTWQCGARVLPSDADAALAWRDLVDSVA